MLASRAADEFLSTLADGDAITAWEHLTPTTRTVIYDDQVDAFARDIAAND